MRAVWLEDGRLSVRDTDRPTLSAGEALVSVVQAGICNTDLELVDGYYPYCGVLGHEFVGVVEDGPDELRGRRVVGEINAACGRCSTCSAGVPSHCPNRTVLGIVDRDGAFAEKLSLPAGNLRPVPQAVSDDAATFTEPLAAALEIQEQVAIADCRRVLVVGSGKLGQLIARSLHLTECELLVLGRRQRTLELLEAQGVEVTEDERRVEGKTFDLAVECTGNADGFELARRALRPRGTLVMKSTYAGSLTLDAAAVVVDELQLVGSRCGPFAPALELLAEGRVEVEDLIDARYPLDDALAAFEHAARPGVLKVLLQVA